MDISVPHLGSAVVEEIGIIARGGDSLQGLGAGQGGAVVGDDSPGSSGIGPSSREGAQCVVFKCVGTVGIGIRIGVIKNIGNGIARGGAGDIHRLGQGDLGLQ